MICTSFKGKLETKLERIQLLALLTIQNTVIYPMIKHPEETGRPLELPQFPTVLQ